MVSYHASFPYLIDWLELDEVAQVEPLPGVAPSPGHIAQVLRTMRQTGSRVILQEMFYPTSSSTTLAELANAEVVVIPGGTDLDGGQRYVDFLTSNADALYTALRQ